MATTIDTLGIAKRWRAAQTEDERAEVLATSLRELQQLQLDQLATKTDLAAAKAALKTDLELLEQRLIIKLGAMLAAAVVIIGGLVALF